MHMLALPGDELVLWHGAGWVQTGTAAGEWRRTLRLPLRSIVDVKPDAGGILAAGAMAEAPDDKTTTVLRVDADGSALGRWTVPGMVYGLVVDERGRAASTAAGLVPLVDDGAMGAPQRLQGGGPAPYSNPPTLVARIGSSTIVCRGQDMSMQHSAPGQCDRRGDAAWHLEGHFALPPVACGDWLVAAEWKRSWSVKVYSIETGKPATQIRVPVAPALACAGKRELFLGGRRLELLRLPGRGAIWSRSVGNGKIVELAVTDTTVVYRADDSPDVVILPRPQARRSRTNSPCAHRLRHDNRYRQTRSVPPSGIPQVPL
jgi:hypothetical protein